MEKLYTIIFRIEIDTLFDESGKLSLKKMEHLAMICTNLHNAGYHVLIVSSGAILLGTAKMGLEQPPTELIAKQAIAAIGQADLMKYYQMFFDSFDQMVAQVLVTRDVETNPVRNTNARMTLISLLQKEIIPIINENDSVSTDDIILNDNYPITLIVAQLIKPHAILVKKKEEGRFLLVVRNNPDIIDVSEEDLFHLAHLIKSGKGIAREINFDCKARKPFSKNGLSVDSLSIHRQKVKMKNGFPEHLTVSY